jgi:hypothetical protein
MEDHRLPEICGSCGEIVRMQVQKGTGACSQNCGRLLGLVD